jgi:hypothetical protein
MEHLEDARRIAERPLGAEKTADGEALEFALPSAQGQALRAVVYHGLAAVTAAILERKVHRPRRSG